MFDLISRSSQQKLNFVFGGVDLQGQDGQAWKVEITCEQGCAICPFLAITG
jgi:hypothetical protein